jgi:hypothetical protein
MRAVDIMGLAALSMSPTAKKYVKHKIKTLIVKEGYSPKQAVATAFNMARKAGYRVPKVKAKISR